MIHTSGALCLLALASLSLGADPTSSFPCDNNSGPTSFGMVLFPSFQALDVFGPLDILNLLALQTKMDLKLIAPTLAPVSTQPRSQGMNKFNSSFAQSIVPTHTFDNAPPVDVLIVPGGLGTRATDINTTVSFIQKAHSSSKHVLSVCTGAGLLARAGVLDSKNATTNKRAWNATTTLGPKTNWIAKARWVRDGNVWTTAGVSAGIDGTLAWIASVYGNDTASNLAVGIEHEWETDPSREPFADYYNLSDKKPAPA